MTLDDIEKLANHAADTEERDIRDILEFAWRGMCERRDDEQQE